MTNYKQIKQNAQSAVAIKSQSVQAATVKPSAPSIAFTINDNFDYQNIGLSYGESL